MAKQGASDEKNIYFEEEKSVNDFFGEFEENKEEYEIGKFNPPAVFHSNLKCKQMLVQLIKFFEIKPSVAAFGLLATSFTSPDSALNFINDASGDNQLAGVKKMKHPFIGCLALSHEDILYENRVTSKTGKSKVLHMQPQDDLESNFNKTICYICDMPI